MIREPAWLQETAGRLERAIEQLTSQFEREPTSGEIAAVLAIPVETVEEIQASRGTFRVVSYDDSTGGDYDGDPCGEPDCAAPAHPAAPAL
jgi:DNA-directed RNA polymerase specialized sigma subunit